MSAPLSGTCHDVNNATLEPPSRSSCWTNGCPSHRMAKRDKLMLRFSSACFFSYPFFVCCRRKGARISMNLTRSKTRHNQVTHIQQPTMNTLQSHVIKLREGGWKEGVSHPRPVPSGTVCVPTGPLSVAGAFALLQKILHPSFQEFVI